MSKIFKWILDWFKINSQDIKPMPIVNTDPVTPIKTPHIVQLTPPAPMEQPLITDKIYNEAKACLGEHITLDPSVSSELGCAEAVSFILKKAGIQGLPQNGFAGTSQLWLWLRAHGIEINQIDTIPGDIIVSPTGTSSKGAPHGHTGIILRYGIASNDSNTGLFRENWSLQNWVDTYTHKLGFQTHIFRLS